MNFIIVKGSEGIILVIEQGTKTLLAGPAVERKVSEKKEWDDEGFEKVKRQGKGSRS